MKKLLCFLLITLPLLKTAHAQEDPYYGKDWKQVTAFISKNLIRSAIKQVDTIYTKAKKAKNVPEITKAIITLMSYQSSVDDSSTEAWIMRLQTDIKQASCPEKQLLSSLLAGMYWSYYAYNRYRFMNRTQTANFDNNDIATWDLTHVVNAAVEYYQASLQNADSLKKIKLDDGYDVVLVKGNTRQLRPTLYDLIAHRALTFYTSEEPDITRPADQFVCNDSAYLSDYDKFCQLNLQTADTLSLKFYALKVYQQLIQFHSVDNNIAALIDVDLERLGYIHGQSVSVYNRDSVYMHTLVRLRNKFINNEASTDVDYIIASHYYTSAGSAGSFTNITRWFKVRAIQICEAAIKRFPDSYGAINCKELIEEIKGKAFTFNTPHVNIPNKLIPASVSYQNINKLYVRIVRISPEKFEESYYYDYYEKLPKSWTESTPVKQWTIDLPEEKDYQYHSVEVKMPALPTGFYVVLMSSSDKFTCKGNQVAYNTIWSSNISYVVRDDRDGSKEYTVLDRTNGKPMKNVNVQVYYTDEYDYTARRYKTVKGPFFTTNDDGYFVVHPVKEKYKNFKLDLTTGNDRFRDWQTSYLYDESYSKPSMYPHDYFYTDRAIYRPGQTVYFKGILTESDGETTYLDTNRSTTVTLYDVNYQQVTSLDLHTDAYGTVNGTFVLPMGLLNGQMRITNGYGTVYIHVEDYKRPKFYVNMDTVKGNYRLGEKVTVSGRTKAYSGASIDGAKVKYSITRRDGRNYWWYGYFWEDYYPYSSASTQISSGTVVTNDTGGFFIDFNAQPDLNMNKQYWSSFIYTVSVDVTDENGETHSSQTEVKVSYAAINLDVQVPQQAEKMGADSFKIMTENMAGSQVNASGDIKIYRLQEPPQVLHNRLWSAPDTFMYKKEQWDTLFPNEPYGTEEGISSWKKGDMVLEQNFNTANRKYFTIPNFKGWKAGTYKLEAQTKDVYGQTVTDTKYFIVYSTQESTIPLNAADWFNAIKEYCEPGEKAQYLIGSAYDNVTVLYEIEKKNKVVHHEWITLNHEQKLIEIPVEEADRGGFAVHFVFVKNNRAYTHDGSVSVPWSNKNLKLSFQSFRDKLLPGQKEEWKIKIRDKDGKKTAAQMMATLYDASLDEFAVNNWSLDIYPTYGAALNWRDPQIFSYGETYECEIDWNPYSGYAYRQYDQLISSGYYYSYGDYYYGNSYRYRSLARDGGGYAYHQNAKFLGGDEMDKTAEKEEDVVTATTGATQQALANATPAPTTIAYQTPTANSESKNEQKADDGAYLPKRGGKGKDEDNRADLTNITARSNFNETAFFYPQLSTDDSGSVVISFTVPEATTKWKMMGLAHTKDLKIGYIQNQLVTQKDLMVTVNAPRFLRESDTITYTAKITNLAGKNLEGTAQLFLSDALDMKDITEKFKVQQLQKQFKVRKGESTVVSWELIVPSGIDAVTYKVVAQAGTYSDGEQNTLPVLTNSMLVTEAIPLSVRGKQNRKFTFDKLINQNNHSTTLRNYKVTLEFTPNPAWYAIQALPYIMEYPYECAEQTFERFYSNSIASNIVNSSPRIKAVFESWKNKTPEAFLSNLEKNQELKSLMLEETPWVLEAQDESERKKRVGILFDFNRMANELDAALRKLEKMQASNGGWPWFPGMPDDRYITQYIITGMGHLDHLGIKNVRGDSKVWNMVTKGVKYLDDRIDEDYRWILKYDYKHKDDDHLSYEAIQYLYARSYFLDIPISSGDEKAVEYFKGQAQKYWMNENIYGEGMIALALSRFKIPKVPMDIMAALKENAINKGDMGMYWAGDIDYGYYWYQAPIEEHALMIECFDEVNHDEISVEALKVWLLRSKQTQDWGTTTATAEACYALLLKGSDLLAREPRIDINLGDKKIKLAPSGDSVMHGEAGTGYFKTSWTGSDINPDMGNITISKSDSGLSWGAVYWQYFEQLDKITPHKTPLNINKKLFVERTTSSGKIMVPIMDTTSLHPGDKVKVRIEIRVDRDMDYVQMKDMRASCMEPVDVISEYKYQDGLGYYQSTRDAATNFFFDHIHKGTYVFEYSMFVTHDGKFSNGITTIQCMYAPEFNSHSEGVRVRVGKK